VLFTDSDMVYETGFFKELVDRLNEEWPKHEDPIFSVGRLSSDVEKANHMVDDLPYPCYLVDTNVVSAICDIPRRNCGAGYFQLIRKHMLNGYYIKGTARDRHLFKDGQKARSDIQFRKRFDLKKLNLSKRQWHLNHIRDNEIGEHTEQQR
jgi:hypothetical protein